MHKPTRQIVVNDLKDKLEDLNLAFSDIEANWCAVRDIMYSTSMEHLGPSVRKHQDWSDQNNTEPPQMIKVLSQRRMFATAQGSTKSQRNAECLEQKNKMEKRSSIMQRPV